MRNGIVCHTRGQQAATLEGQVVRLADQIAYINHDIEDALRGGVIYPMDIPLEVSSILGFTHGERINALVLDVIRSSRDQDSIRQSEEVGQAMAVLREFMFESVYTNPLAKGGGRKGPGDAPPTVRLLPPRPGRPPRRLSGDPPGGGRGPRGLRLHRLSMTDPFAIEQFSRLFIPTAWSVK